MYSILLKSIRSGPAHEHELRTSVIGFSSPQSEKTNK